MPPEPQQPQLADRGNDGAGALPDLATPAGAEAYEHGLAVRAAELRGDKLEIDNGLLLALWPLLAAPIPPAYIQTIGPVEGKPYPTTGIRSVQVQIDRMNNVLTPLWWWDAVFYEQEGKLAQVVVYIGNYRGPDGQPEVLVARSSRGGVNRATTTGNLFKGSYTSAAKRAFAAIGPGHEVYLGTTDLDPDVDPQAAAAAAPAQGGGVGKDIARALVDRAWKIPEKKERLQLAASHAAGADVGNCSTKAKATEALATLDFDQAQRVENWIARPPGAD